MEQASLFTFPQPLNIPVILPNGREGYILAQDYSYEWTFKGNLYKIVVPKGFMYDGASVPRAVWTLSGITPDGLIRAAATVHDELYDCRGRIPDGMLFVRQGGEWLEIKGSVWPRVECDNLFYRILIDSGYPDTKAYAAYLAVRAFGFTGWN